MRWNMKKAKRWGLYSLAGLMVLGLVGIAALISASIVIWAKLPGLDELTDYRPRVPLRVYTADGFLIKEIGEERRTVIKIENVPDSLKQALLATEDAHFYEHKGVDPTGIMRAILANLRGRKQGASTITMQVARNFFLKRDQTLTRKLYEILLSIKIERILSKDQILERYINHIYLGQRAYGFEVAAQTYFGRSLGELTLAEIAMLGGLPKGPAILNPIVNPEGARRRQRYVLKRMRDVGYIDEAAYQAALAEPLQTASGSAARDPSVLSPVHAEYVAEMARQIAVAQFGEPATQRGMKVITTITRAEQEAAYEALRQGVMDYDHRHGYRGPEKYITLPEGKVEAGKIGEEFARKIDDELIKAREEDEQRLSDYGDLLLAVVIAASPEEVTVYRNGALIRIGESGLKFAEPMLQAKAPQARRVRPGALVRIRDGGERKGWELTQSPEVDAALVSIDARTGAVRALVGGFDFNHNQFNNVTMARRQPGSSFKPFIYSASLEHEKKVYSPGTLLKDEPMFIPEKDAGGKKWEPNNYDKRFDGPMTMRDALARSKNIPVIRVLEDITPAYAQGYIANFGFDAVRHPPYLTMALGAGAASPWEMAAAYAVFANGGYRINPFVVSEIRDANDKMLARFNLQVAGKGAPNAITPRNAWIMNSMLQDVVRRGTGSRARTLGRKDIAGKTGTTNDYGDAWFCGYNPAVVAVSWIGFPTPRNMGSGETGGTVALPMWVNYMRFALADVPDMPFPRPLGICSDWAGEGDYEDFYYCDKGPPLLPLLPGGDIGDLPIPNAPPAPIPQNRSANPAAPPRQPGGAGLVKPEDEDNWEIGRAHV
jgi:penicillin-binding protein 1A